MNRDTFALRIARLRMQKGVSAKDMSLLLGQSDSYISKIENRHTLPSMTVFFAICDYLGITPQEFFDDGNGQPEFLRGLIADLKKLDAAELAHISGIIKGLIKGK
ncbi:MAG: helix-turn-helix transcriptional regulator [Oscillospiraceae bacterium]|jgi:transcriptional regulator with XRE-family HTH domain|nr:helix-turn-helix transcriptional regulator [Oscillospiraceae bacterium]